MADYYLAPSLISLRNEINEANPNRDKSSDGWIGDASHAARLSDHNPDWAAGGVVRAIDVDVDGCDPDHLIAVAIADPRTEYVISRGFIYERSTGFRKRVYTGVNKHDHHTHISLRHIKSAEKSGRWGYVGSAPAAPAPAAGSGALPLDQIARQVIAGSWGSGDDRARRLNSAGYDAAAVQTEVNRILVGAPAPAKKSVAEIADEVIAGHWGNNPQRGVDLIHAGYSPSEVQAAVNAKLNTTKAGPTQTSVAALATQVIAGQWGTGAERERRISQAGFDYAAVRAEVNRRLA